MILVRCLCRISHSFIHSPTHPPTGGRRDKDKRVRVSPTRRCLCDSLANERFRFCPAETSEYSSSDGRACSLVLFALETVVMDGPSLLYRFCVAFAAAAQLLHFSPFISESIDSDESTYILIRRIFPPIICDVGVAIFCTVSLSPGLLHNY